MCRSPQAAGSANKPTNTMHAALSQSAEAHRLLDHQPTNTNNTVHTALSQSAEAHRLLDQQPTNTIYTALSQSAEAHRLLDQQPTNTLHAALSQSAEAHRLLDHQPTSQPTLYMRHWAKVQRPNQPAKQPTNTNNRHCDALLTGVQTSVGAPLGCVRRWL
jgi:hypothetical protein